MQSSRSERSELIPTRKISVLDFCRSQIFGIKRLIYWTLFENRHSVAISVEDNWCIAFYSPKSFSGFMCLK